MTEPDEALLYARRQLANTWRKDGAPPKAVAAALAGEFDDVLGLAAHDYRAGARMATERERERAKVLVEFAVALETFGLDDSISAIPRGAREALAKYRGEA